jgi:hypothetical protein
MIAALIALAWIFFLSWGGHSSFRLKNASSAKVNWRTSVTDNSLFLGPRLAHGGAEAG